MTRYQVILTNGKTINVPSDKARTAYEEISQYGLEAVIERAKRTRAYKAAEKENGEVRVHTIICPDGEEVTQF